MWSFVRLRGNKRWIWLALCRQTKQVVACVIGGRGIATCRQLWNAIPALFKQGICFTDFWEAYRAIIPDDYHQAVGKSSGLTNHVERFNLTIRQRLARFVRRTLSFSKSDHMHLICLHLFLHSYNLERLALIRK
jgi:insertion element IS1 protein InsB